MCDWSRFDYSTRRPVPLTLSHTTPHPQTRLPIHRTCRNGGGGGGGGAGGSRGNVSSNPTPLRSSSLGPRRVDGSRSDPTRAGLGLDESEWEEPERLSSTPMPSPMGSTRGGGGKMTPMTVNYVQAVSVG